MTDTATLITPSPNECFAEAAKELRNGNLELSQEWRQLGDVIARYIKYGGS